MQEIGRIMQETREQIGLTLEEVENTIHIRIRYLQLLEDGNLEALPSPVQARGFLRNYIEFLGLDSQLLMIQYAEALQRKVQSKAGKVGLSEPSVRKKRIRLGWVTSDRMIYTVLVIILTVALIWGGSKIFAQIQADRNDVAEIAALSSITPTANLAPTDPPRTLEPEGTQLPGIVLQISPTSELALSLDFATGVNITLVIEQRAWLQVQVDGEQQFSGRASAGDVFEYRGTESIEVLTGNAGGVRVYFNGNDQGLLGGIDQRELRIWSPAGFITTTPTITLTPAETNTATITPELSSTATTDPDVDE